MSFRNRPVLDRRHRPRWQDELRTQQLIVAGFALAIAVAVGIFGAVAWSSFYNANLRQVALVGDRSVERAELTRRADLIAAQLSGNYLELASQLGGTRDQLIQQQMGSLQEAISSVEDVASDSMVTGLVLDTHAPRLGLGVPDDELDAEVSDRMTLPERVRLSIITVSPEPDEGAEEGAEPTAEDWEEARAAIDDIKAQLDDDGDFAELARRHSDHASAESGGALGWITAEDASLADYFEASHEVAAGGVAGPLRDQGGWHLLKVEERLEERRDEQLESFLEAAGISDQDYRSYVRQELLQREFREYFGSQVVGRYGPQRHVAQILLRSEGAAAAPSPEIHIRHLLAKPLPDETDQSGATDEQWEAARQRAEELRTAAMEPDADWYVLADRSDDPGSRTSGGSLGWHDPAALEAQFVPEFADAARALEVGELSEPVRSEFGYHIIQVTDRRVSVMEHAERLAADLRQDPDSFTELARQHSQDPVTSEQGGDLGWVQRYELEPELEEAVFALSEPGQISEPVVTDRAVYLFKLIDAAEARFIPAEEREQVSSVGFSRWLAQLRREAGVWLDPELAPATDGTDTPVLTP